LVGWDELAPGTNIQDDAGLARVIDEQRASYKHPTLTAPMGGETDQWAVVDNMGSVRGVTGLRVINASIRVARSPTSRRSSGGGLPGEGDVRERLRRRVLLGETSSDVHTTHEGDVSELLGVVDEASQSV
jgi:hypothetical protein